MTWEEQVNAAVLNDLLAAAQELLDDGYLLAGTVCAGASLEEHLRKLAVKHDVDIQVGDKWANASKLNDQLQKKAYSTAHHDQIGGWLKIRNEGAHGEA